MIINVNQALKQNDKLKGKKITQIKELTVYQQVFL